MSSAQNDIIVEARDLKVSFMIAKHGINNIKDFIITMGIRKPFVRKEVLKGINLEIKKGESFGVIGRNGSGKSTFLRSIAGIMKPDSGFLAVRGKVAPMMAINAGLEPEMTGEENIKLLGTLMGYSSKEVKESLDEIISFSELSQADIESQVKRYSNGMMARLAFSITVARTPEILIVDEALSVGDLGFRKKCAARIEEIKNMGSTIIYVSHDMDEIKRICTRACLLNDGVIEKVGEVDDIIAAYEQAVSKKKVVSD